MYTATTEITDSEAMAQVFRTAIAGTEAKRYTEHTAIYRWLNGVGKSTRVPRSLTIDLDLPDLAIEMEEAFEKISDEAYRQAITSPPSFLTPSASVVNPRFSRASSMALSSSSTLFNSTNLHGIEAEKLRRRFGWDRFSSRTPRISRDL